MLIKRIYRALRWSLKPFVWNNDAKKIRKIILKTKLKPKQLSLEGKVLILAPHSDDEWIGCFSLVENHDCAICSMDMVGGNDDEQRAKRFLEMKAIAVKYKRELVRVGEPKTESLIDLIASFRPSYIAVPFFIDWHEEHIATMNILKDSVSNYDGKIICYQVSCPIPMSYVTHVAPLSKTDWKRKWSLFRTNYKTQNQFPWKRFSAIEKAEGAYSNTYASNVFSVFDAKDWVASFDIIPSRDKIDAIKEALNTPEALFLQVNKYGKDR